MKTFTCKRRFGFYKMRITATFFQFVIMLALSLNGNTAAQPKLLVSKLNQYAGYSQPIYKDWVQISEYITVRDGTRLAADIFRPAENGRAVTIKLPVIWTHNRYHRAPLQNGKFARRIDSPWIQTLLRHGYVIVDVDVRGGGGSFGTQEEPFSEKETQDAYDITESLARQPWCNGNVGMYGSSYLGITQYLAASQKPPHLKAIFPEMALFDYYFWAYPGGIFRDDFISSWQKLTRDLDLNIPTLPVDQDKDGALLRKAVADHRSNRDIFDLFKPIPYRDSADTLTQQKTFLKRSPSSYIKAINESNVAIYHLAGWFDLFSKDAFLWFANLKKARKIVIGPWTHVQRNGFNNAVEHLRWYDYWLKGIDNGIANEAPIHYYTIGAPKGSEWRSAWQWPLPTEKPTRYYFHAGQSKSVNSINDGILNQNLPRGKSAYDDYIVDYSTTSGKPSRWSNGYGAGGGNFSYPDMTPNDRKGLTFTTLPMTHSMELTGHPLIHLWVTSTAKDGDFFVYLEDIDANGFSRYVTEGMLRASHRKLSKPPFNNIGLPYHRSFVRDLIGLSEKPSELAFDLLPISYVFGSGHRIRITITCTDRDNTFTPQLTTPPKIRIHRSPSHSSYIILPIIPALIIKD